MGNVRRCPRDDSWCGNAACNSGERLCIVLNARKTTEATLAKDDWPPVKTTLESHICPSTGKHCYSEICVLGQTCARMSSKGYGGAINPIEAPVSKHYSTSYSTTPAKDCHKGQHFLGILNKKCNIHIGRQADFVGNTCQATGKPFKLLISLLGDTEYTQPRPPTPGKQVVTPNKEATKMVPAALCISKPASGGENWPRVPVLGIDWPDFGVLEALDHAWWQEMVKFLSTIKGDVGVFCHGGHGRTGTFAAVLAGLTGMVDPTKVDVVKWLRDRYCEKIVESDKQFRYIESMLDLPQGSLKSAPSKTHGGVYSGNYGGGGKASFVWDGKKNKLVEKSEYYSGKGATKGCIDNSLSKRQMKRMLKRFGPEWHGVRPKDLEALESFEAGGHTYRWDEQTQAFKEVK